MFFPKNSIELSKRVKTGTDSFGDDIFEDITEIIKGVILAPYSTSDEAAPHELHDRVTVELHLPKTFSNSVANSTFKALDGVFAGRVFRIEGDALPLAYSPLPWNRRVIAQEIY